MARLICSPTDAIASCSELEQGNILFFPEMPFAFPQEDLDFLLMQKQGSSKGRKNIAYKPQSDCVTNHESKHLEERTRMHQILRNYSLRVTAFLSRLISPYAEDWKLDYASFRPFQEKGRTLRLRARNDLLHVDAFPTRPTKGGRILRFFTNINPKEPRVWITSNPFGELLHQFRDVQEFPAVRPHSQVPFMRWLRKVFCQRSPYDAFMLRMHHFLKENTTYQAECQKDRWEFPPFSCWVVFTDQVSHAALAGQYALEQTYLVPRCALLFPERAPISLLERMVGATLCDEERISI
jgi:hypothetical protein